MRACACVCVCVYIVCMYVCGFVVCIRHEDERSATSRAIIHRPPARSLDRSIVCSICVTRLVLRFTNNMLRALPMTSFSPCDALGISRYTHPEGEGCMYTCIGHSREWLYVPRSEADLKSKSNFCWRGVFFLLANVHIVKPKSTRAWDFAKK